MNLLSILLLVLWSAFSKWITFLCLRFCVYKLCVRIGVNIIFLCFCTDGADAWDPDYHTTTGALSLIYTLFSYFLFYKDSINIIFLSVCTASPDAWHTTTTSVTGASSDLITLIGQSSFSKNFKRYDE